MHVDAERQTFVLLGAAGGIGSALARLLAANGCRLLLAGRTAEKLTTLSKEIDAPIYEVDATNIAAVENCLNHAGEQFGHVDGVVNCVGSVLLKPAHLTSEQDWQETIALK